MIKSANRNSDANLSDHKVLVLGNYFQTITVIRSLAKMGYGVIVGSSEKSDYTRFSRNTSEIWQHPAIETAEDEFIDALAAFLAIRQNISLIFPVGESDIRCFANHPHVIPASCVVVMTAPSVFNICLDKLQLNEIAAAEGIPCAMYCRISALPELAPALQRVGYPCVLKPNTTGRSSFDKKALILRTPADVPELQPAWPGEDLFILQKYALGRRHNCHFVADNGLLRAYFEQCVLRTDETDDTGYGVDGISVLPSPVLKAYCAKLTHKLTYSGAGCAQFLVDDQSGAVCFLELNPRLDATCALPFYCGYDFPKMAAMHAEYRHGDRLAPPEECSSYPVGKRGYSLWRDIRGFVRAARNRKLGTREAFLWLNAAILSSIDCDFPLFWSWIDPMPALYLCVVFVIAACKGLARIVGRSLRH